MRGRAGGGGGRWRPEGGDGEDRRGEARRGGAGRGGAGRGGIAANAPHVPTAAATEDMASERWCFADAMRTGERSRRATRRVTRKRYSCSGPAATQR